MSSTVYILSNSATLGGREISKNRVEISDFYRFAQKQGKNKQNCKMVGEEMRSWGQNIGILINGLYT